MDTKKKFTPIKLLEMIYDEENESLVFKLSDRVNEKWIHLFRSQKKKGGVHYSSEVIDVSLFEFNQNIARLPMSISTYNSLPKKSINALPPYPSTLENIRDIYFKEYLEQANALYEEMLDEEAQRDTTE